VYDLITQYNYMYHREIYAKVAELIASRWSDRRYELLDLGCGNARFMAPVLLQTPAACYQGVDLSEEALDEAEGYLADVPGVHQLTHLDLLDAIQSTDRNWDIVFSGFALHHLVQEQKARLFDEVAKHLGKEGWFLLVDVVREEDQSRREYLDQYVRMMCSTWSAMPSDQLEQACAHVSEFDYPETMSALSDMARASGLNNAATISRYDQHHLMLFSRN